MLTRLGGRTALVVAVLLLFCYGIVGIPHGGLKHSISKRINLGLDLKGGIHLVLQVHVSEALGSATDRDAAKLDSALQAKGITGVTVGKADSSHPETISVTGVPIARMSEVRSLLEGPDYSIYDVASQQNGAFKLTMKPSAIESLEALTLDRSIETIRRRVNSLGLPRQPFKSMGSEKAKSWWNCRALMIQHELRRSSSPRQSWRFMPWPEDLMKMRRRPCRRTTAPFLSAQS
jgi:preprotein translocase subunit SecD